LLEYQADVEKHIVLKLAISMEASEGVELFQKSPDHKYFASSIALLRLPPGKHQKLFD